MANVEAFDKCLCLSRLKGALHLARHFNAERAQRLDVVLNAEV